MSLLSSIEARISKVVEGTFGRLSRSHVQPVELARRLTKEMDDHQSASISRVFVPNVYDIYLSTEDYRNFGSISAELCAELGEYLYAHAQKQGYALHSRPRVHMREDGDLTLGAFGIATAIDAGDSAPVATSDAEAEEPASSRTMIFTPEQQKAAVAVQLELQTPSGPVRLEGDPVTIGRGRANTVVIHDSSVSREHATIIPSGTGFLVRDLGSTNGVLVNGVQVEERSIKAGDTLLLGNVELRIVQIAGEGPAG